MDPYIGEIRLLPFTFAPYGWLDCSGQLLSIAQFGTLYSVIGIAYGGDGVANFKLPNLNVRAPLGMGNAPA